MRSEYGIVPGKSISYPAAYKAFKNLFAFAGLDPSKFALHSPRVGGATDAFNAGVPAYVIDRQGRWKSSDTKYLYLRLKEDDIVRRIKKAAKY